MRKNHNNDLPKEKNLTQKLDMGELEEGLYYIRTAWREDRASFYYKNDKGDFFDESRALIKEVLAPVPSYQEYTDIEEYCAFRTMQHEEDLRKLKEIEEKLKEHNHYCCCTDNEILRLKLTKMIKLLAEARLLFVNSRVKIGFQTQHKEWEKDVNKILDLYREDLDANK